MKEFPNIIQKFIKNHEKHKKYLAFLVVLSLMIGITVPMVLTEPAESMTGQLVCGLANHVHSEECINIGCDISEHEHTQGCYLAANVIVNTDEIMNADDLVDDVMPMNNPLVMPIEAFNGDHTWFDEVQTSVPVGASQITSIDDITITYNGTSYKDGDTIPNTSSDLLKDLGFRLEFQVDPDSVDLDQPYLYYQLPAGVTIPDGLYGKDYPVMEGDVTAGYYSISPDGLIVIRFTNSYIEDRINEASGPLSAFMNFKADVKRANTADGDRDLNFDNEHKIHVDFPTKEKYGIEKQGRVVKASDPNSHTVEVEWTITVNRYSKNYPFKDFEVIEDHSFDLKNGSITVTPSPYSSYGKFEGSKFIFTGEPSTNEVTFKFREVIPWDEYQKDYGNNYNMHLSNKATLQRGEENDDNYYKEEVTAGTDLDKKPSITKDGKADYEWTENAGFGRKIKWSISVNHPYGTSLGNYYIVDDKLKDAQNLKVYTVNKNGERVEFDPKNYIFDQASGKLTIKDSYNNEQVDAANNLEIVYETVIPEGENYDSSGTIHVFNNAKLYPPSTVDNPGNPDGTVDSDRADVYYKHQQTMNDKNGYYDRTNGKIEWTIGAHVRNQKDNITLNGYTMSDAALNGVDFREILDDVTAKFNNQNLNVNREACTEDTIVFTDGSSISKSGGTLTVHGNIHSFSLKYKTDPKKAGSDGTVKEERNGRQYVTNTSHDGIGPDKSFEVDITPNDTTSKSPKGSTGLDILKDAGVYFDPKTGKVYDENGVLTDQTSFTGTLSWEVIVNKDAGFGADALVDTVSSGINNVYKDYTGITHTINADSIEIESSMDGEHYTPVDTSKYKVALSNGDTQFNVSFNPALTNARYIKVTYTSNVTIDLTKSSSWTFDNDGKIVFKFQNNANGFNAWTNEDFTVKNNDVIRKTNLTIEKKWNVPDSFDRSTLQPIEFKLQRKAVPDGEWQTIYWDATANDGKGSWVVDEADTHTYTLTYDDADNNSGGNWKKSWNDMPAETADHNTTYYYRAVEVTEIEGFSTTYGSENTDSSTYFENGVSSGPFYITNTKNPDVDKILLNKYGDPITDSTLELSQLQRANVRGVDCYVLSYQIELVINKNQTVVVDKLPDYFTLAFDSSDEFANAGLDPHDLDSVNVPFHPRIDGHGPLHDFNHGRWAMWYKKNKGEEADYTKGTERLGQREFNYYADSNKALFSIDVGDTINYEIIIPVEDLEDLLNNNKKYVNGLPVKNSIKVGEGAPKSVEVTIVKGDSDKKFDENLIEKTVTNESDNGTFVANNGKIDYTLYVNPDGRDIANGDEFDITDTLILYGYGQGLTHQEIMRAIVAGQLTVKVETMDDPPRPLNPGEYRYNVEYKPGLVVDEQPVNVILENPYNKTYYIKGDWQPKDTIKITLTGEPNHQLTEDDALYSTISYQQVKLLNLAGKSLDKSGKLTVEVDLPPDTGSEIWFDAKSGCDVETVSAIRNNSTMDASARMVLTVPDGTPLKITYSYIITDKNGDYINGIFSADNTASINTENASAWDSNDATFESSFQADAGIKADKTPKLVKYNVTNQGEVLTNAEFYVAKFEDDAWKFASNDAQENKSANGINETLHTFTFDTAATGNEIPEKNVVKVETTTDRVHRVYLEEGCLYKFVEVKAPTGYEGAALENLEALIKKKLKGETISDPKEAALVNKFVEVHYFVYGNAKVKDKPSDYESLNVDIVQPGGMIGVPNNKLVDIEADKKWDSTVEEKDQGNVTFELYWSYDKPKDGSIPENISRVSETLAELGLTADDVDCIKTTELEPADPSNPDAKPKRKCVWHGLPNGKDDSPIYYYVKEIAYTVNGKNYKLDESDGKFYQVDENGNFVIVNDEKVEGRYKPVYKNNGTNDDSINVTNTVGLVIVKLWRNNNNKEMKKNKIPYAEIEYELWGTNSKGKEVIIQKGKLGKDNDWTVTVLPEKIVGYTNLRVVEKVTSEMKDNFDTDTNNNVIYDIESNSTIGEISVINKSKMPTGTDVTVEKEWSGGNEGHTEEITILLYCSPRKLKPEEEKALREGKKVDGVELVKDRAADLENGITEISHEITLGGESGKWEYTWHDLDYSGQNVPRYYYYAIEEVPTGYTAIYDGNYDRPDLQTITITNTRPGSLTAEKQWENQNHDTIKGGLPSSITLELYQRAIIKDSGSGSGTGSGSDTETGSGSGTGSGSDTETGSGSGTGSGSDTETTTEPRVDVDSFNRPDPPPEVKSKGILTLGDSITDGTFNGITNNYPKVFQDMYFKDQGVTVNKNGQISAEISGILNNAKGDSRLQNVAVVCLIAGTNDLLHLQDPIKTDDGSPDIEDRLKGLIDYIYSQNPDVHLIVGKIPKLTGDALKNNWINRWNPRGEWQNFTQADSDALFTSYNDMLEELVDHYTYNGKTVNISWVDLYTAVGDNLADGCHPDEKGYMIIAREFYQAIFKSYGQTVEAPLFKNETAATVMLAASAGARAVDFRTNLGEDGFPKDFWTNDQKTTVSNLYYKYDTVTVTPDEKGNWTYPWNDLPQTDGDGNTYVYYIVEKCGDKTWNVTYSGNGATLETEKTIEITNSKRTVNLDITKTWDENGETGIYHDKILLRVFRSKKAEHLSPDITVEQEPLEICIEGEPFEKGKTYPVTEGGGELHITTNKKKSEVTIEKVEVDFDDPGIIKGTIEVDNDKGIVSGGTPGKARVKVTWLDGNGEYHYEYIDIEVKPIEFALVSESESAVIYKGGDPATFLFNKNIDHVEVTVVEPEDGVDIVSCDKDGKNLTVTGKKAGKVTIKVYSTVSTEEPITVTVEVKLTEFKRTNPTEEGPYEIVIEDGMSFTFNKKISDVKASEEGIVSWDGKGSTTLTVTGLKEGDVTLTVYDEDGQTLKIVIHVSEDNTGFYLTLNGKKIKNNDVIELEVKQTIELKTNNGQGIIYGPWLDGKITMTPDQQWTDVFTVTGLNVTTNNIQVGVNGPNNQSVTVYFKVNPYVPLIEFNPTEFTIPFGTEVTLSNYQRTNKQGIQYSIESGGEFISMIDASTGKIKANDVAGTATVIATYLEGSKTDRITFTIRVYDPNASAKDPDTGTITSGQMLPIASDPVATIVIDFSDYTDTNWTNIGEINLIKNGSSIAKITGNINGGYLTANLSVNDAQYNGKISINYDPSTDRKLTITCSGVTLDSLGIGMEYHDWEGGWVATTTYTYNVSYTINYAQPTPTPLSMSSRSYAVSAISNVRPDMEIPNGVIWVPYVNEHGYEIEVLWDPVKKEYVTFELNGDADVNWHITIDDLPASYIDEATQEEKEYYYWVEEESIGNAYDASYVFTDNDINQDRAINALNPGDGKIQITNTRTISQGTTMPSTGGSGTRKYYVFGITIMLMGAGYAMLRRMKGRERAP